MWIGWHQRSHKVPRWIHTWLQSASILLVISDILSLSCIYSKNYCLPLYFCCSECMTFENSDFIELFLQLPVVNIATSGSRIIVKIPNVFTWFWLQIPLTQHHLSRIVYKYLYWASWPNLKDIFILCGYIFSCENLVGESYLLLPKNKDKPRLYYD